MKQFFTFLAAILITATTSAQIGINNENPDASAALDITSTMGGLLPPRMTSAQRDNIVSPVEGLIIFCTDCGSGEGELQIKLSSQWGNLYNPGSGGGQNSYLLRLEYDASNHLIDGPGNRFMTGVANYISEGAVVNSVNINTSSAVYSVNVSFANQSTPPSSITVMAWDPGSENYDYHAYNTDAGQLEIVGATFTNDESGQWTPDIFSDFSSSSINIDVRQQYIKYGNSVAFPPPSRYAHAYLIFNFEAINEE